MAAPYGGGDGAVRVTEDLHRRVVASHLEKLEREWIKARGSA